MAFLSINGVDIDALGLKLIDQGPIWSGVGFNRGSSGVLGRVGQRTLGVSTSPAQQITLELALDEGPTTRRAALDRVFAALDGLLVLEWSDAPERVQYARLDRSNVGPRFAQIAWLAQSQLRVSLSLIADNPAYYDWAAYSEGWGPNGRATVELGTLPSSPLLTFGDTVSGTITVEYRGQTGALLSSLVLANPSLSAGQELLIDCGTEQIFKAAGATLTESNNLYSSGSFPTFDPGDGNFAGDSWPTIGANFAGVATYRRVWA